MIDQRMQDAMDVGAMRYADVIAVLNGAGLPTVFTQTGGMCAALEVTLEAGQHLLITDAEDSLSWDRDEQRQRIRRRPPRVRRQRRHRRHQYRYAAGVGARRARAGASSRRRGPGLSAEPNPRGGRSMFCCRWSGEP